MKQFLSCFSSSNVGGCPPPVQQYPRVHQVVVPEETLLNKEPPPVQKETNTTRALPEAIEQRKCPFRKRMPCIAETLPSVAAVNVAVIHDTMLAQPHKEPPFKRRSTPQPDASIVPVQEKNEAVAEQSKGTISMPPEQQQKTEPIAQPRRNPFKKKMGEVYTSSYDADKVVAEISATQKSDTSSRASQLSRRIDRLAADIPVTAIPKAKTTRSVHNDYLYEATPALHHGGSIPTKANYSEAIPIYPAKNFAINLSRNAGLGSAIPFNPDDDSCSDINLDTMAPLALSQSQNKRAGLYATSSNSTDARHHRQTCDDLSDFDDVNVSALHFSLCTLDFAVQLLVDAQVDGSVSHLLLQEVARIFGEFSLDFNSFSSSPTEEMAEGIKFLIAYYTSRNSEEAVRSQLLTLHPSPKSNALQISVDSHIMNDATFAMVELDVLSSLSFVMGFFVRTRLVERLCVRGEPVIVRPKGDALGTVSFVYKESEDAKVLEYMNQQYMSQFLSIYSHAKHMADTASAHSIRPYAGEDP